ncbi:hypothetical protein AGABI2DRAFT_182617 [Agaricus bisporus var. bisporus H97]|uniref:hypothetical protein n=1 Tax=Agaricus bisporus var. bisporus (strain H97 / ATCC MYA-4626 / FGSC 10389) TaxID=936046 RepID=UPI00029F5A8F|nr:hypothetical protein AGABI2DRAFT_182617 [Agaricus bisporus var. bisporus H97]EKV51665.1 hypothetical protein AGABI2DRAFT_182617 [Agaricus bisporus var. bisporus H97]
MARIIPSSLSPHVCILSSPDLCKLLDSSSLPSLPEILQSFSPLPQVTTRTTSLTSVPHATFALRFSDLIEIEEACREDEERRATRLIDWMSGRISQKCARWLSEMEEPEAKGKERDAWRTPWWDEVRRCAEGDHVPSRYEGWNHPVAIILAVSTTAPNPLQAITALHARSPQLPPWVDANYLKYTVIIHPHDSPLSDDEAGALHNAVKKQFGIDVYWLSLALPSPPPTPVPVPLLLPRLPRVSLVDGESMTQNENVNGSEPHHVNVLRMVPEDIQQTSKFAREFVVGCLIPWMEKNVLDWSEAFSSNRRLPSRLFSSTRRLFGTSSPAPSYNHHTSSSVASISRSSTSSNNSNAPSPPSQQRRLAEFATIIGDYKLAVTVWESLRKELKGGSDILPLVVSSSPALSLHAATSLAVIYAGNQELSPQALSRALIQAVRWETGIPTQEFVNNVLEGERWLAWAAGNSEEVPAALLIAHAAHLSEKKQTRRRAAYWYAIAASRLERCGIKPLTMYFLRKAQELYRNRVPKELSPSYWDAEGQSATGSTPWFDAIISGIEHPLGRLLYTTGDVLSAVRLFLGLLQGFEDPNVAVANLDGEVKQSSSDKHPLDDFRVAFGYLNSMEPEKAVANDLKLPLKFCQVRQSKLRFPGADPFRDSVAWEKRAEDWNMFWKSTGKRESFAKSGDIIIGESFWVDLVVRNPLDAELNLANLTLVVRDMNGTQPDDESHPLVDVDVIEDVFLSPLESRIISIAITPQHSGTFQIPFAKYDFLSLLPITESLAMRGQRLNATPAQRRQPTYAPDVLMKFDVAEATHKLVVNLVEDGRLEVVQGERRITNLWLANMGSRPVEEIWMVPDPEDEIWIGDTVVEGESEENTEENGINDDEIEVVKSSNSLVPPQPLRIPIPGGVLSPDDGFSVPLTLHMEAPGEKPFCLFFVYRQDDTDTFHTSWISRIVDVKPLFNIALTVEPDQSPDCQFALNVSLNNISSAPVRLTQVSTVSPSWCSSMVFDSPLYANCSIQSPQKKNSFSRDTVMAFIHGARRNFVSKHTSSTHVHIPQATHPHIFPLYNPASFDVILFWEFINPSETLSSNFTSAFTSAYPSPSASFSLSRASGHIPRECRSGHVTIHGLTLGATHAPLQEVIEEFENAKGKRSMYAETVRENSKMLETIRVCEWNQEMNPLNVSIKGTDGFEHDFSVGPCWKTLDLTIRNFSLTHEAGFVLKLRSGMSVPPSNVHVLPPPYAAKLNFSGSIPPSGSVTLHPKLWITRPGAYSLEGWKLDTEVYENLGVDSGHDLRLRESSFKTKRKVRHRYTLERPVEGRIYLVVQNASRRSS